MKLNRYWLCLLLAWTFLLLCASIAKSDTHATPLADKILFTSAVDRTDGDWLLREFTGEVSEKSGKMSKGTTIRFCDTGKISGVVRLPGGQPAEGMRVRVESKCFATDCVKGPVIIVLNPGEDNFGKEDGSVRADGSYTIGNLRPGWYRVYVDGTEKGYPRKYYPDTYDSDLALPVEVVGGEERWQVDLALENGGGITGVFTIPDGMTPEKGEVYAWCEENGYYMSGEVDAEGAYAISGLPPGQYRVCARLRETVELETCFGGSGECGSYSSVEVAAGEVTGNINIEMAVDGKIAGVVTAPEGGFRGGAFRVCIFRLTLFPLLSCPGSAGWFIPHKRTVGRKI